MDKPIIIDTPEGIEHYRVCVLIACLRIEVNTGMKASRGNVLQAAKSSYPVTGRTKKKVLEELLAYYKDTYGMEYGKAKNNE